MHISTVRPVAIFRLFSLCLFPFRFRGIFLVELKVNHAEPLVVQVTRIDRILRNLVKGTNDFV